MAGNSVVIGGEQVKVEAMSMDNYVKFVSQVQVLQSKLEKVLKDYGMKSLLELLEAPGNKMAGFAMDVMVTAPDDFFSLMAIVLDTEVKTIKKGTPIEVLEAFDQAKKVNDFKGMWGMAKKVLGLTSLTRKKQKRS